MFCFRLQRNYTEMSNSVITKKDIVIKVLKNVTSGDKGDVEDPDDNPSGGSGNTPGGGGSSTGSGGDDGDGGTTVE